jgi:hypothetical protein
MRGDINYHEENAGVTAADAGAKIQDFQTKVAADLDSNATTCAPKPVRPIDSTVQSRSTTSAIRWTTGGAEINAILGTLAVHGQIAAVAPIQALPAMAGRIGRRQRHPPSVAQSITNRYFTSLLTMRS